MKPRLRVAVLGYGAIGSALVERLGDLDVEVGIVARRAPEGPAAALPLMSDPEALLAWAPDVVVECAGHGALKQYGVAVLRAGRSLVVASVGALSDAALERDIRDAASAGGGVLHVVPGALAGLDALSAIPKSKLAEVRYAGAKPPTAWKGTAAETMIQLDEVSERVPFFEGTAREAASLFPKNANVIAAVALAGRGFDDTRATLSVDPRASGNEHFVAAVGDFGVLEVLIRSNPLAGNAKSSAMTPDSLFRCVRNMVSPVVI